MTRVCAIISFYNEEDILEESILSLIENEIDVYLINNNSTDGSNEIAQSYLGRGVVGIENIIFTDDHGNEIYNWTEILKRKQLLAHSLDYDWFIHADADEQRIGPWEDLNLRESIERVEKQGFAQINFKVFNFRPTSDIEVQSNFFREFSRFSPAHPSDSQQVKCWRKSSHLALPRFGGHRACLAGRIYPIRFILKHYPLRTENQIKRKIFIERYGRFSQSERNMGWHCHYDQFLEEGLKLRWNEAETIFYNEPNERIKVKEEALQVLSAASVFEKRYVYDPIEEGIISDIIEILKRSGLDEGKVKRGLDTISKCILDLHEVISSKSYNPVCVDQDVALFMAVRYVASQFYLCGRPRLWENLISHMSEQTKI